MRKLSLVVLAIGTATLLAGCNPEDIDKSIKKEADHLTQDLVASTFAVALVNVDFQGASDNCYAVTTASASGNRRAFWASRDLNKLQEHHNSNTLFNSFKQINNTQLCKELGVGDLVETVKVTFDGQGHVASLYRDWGGVKTSQDFNDRHRVVYQNQNYGKISVRIADKDDPTTDSSWVIERQGLSGEKLYVTTAELNHDQDFSSDEEQTSFANFAQFLDKGGMTQVPNQLETQANTNRKWNDNMLEEINNFHN